MSKFQFEKGARVVVVFSEASTDSDWRKALVGQAGTVTYASNTTPGVTLDSGKHTFFCDDELELEHVFNSPLNKALR